MALRFSTAYGALMLACAAAALAIPAYTLDGVRQWVSLAFVPVSRPTLAVANAVANKVSPGVKPGAMDPSSPRKEGDAMAENALLRGRINALLTQVDELNRRLSERANLGEAADRSVGARVTGVDASLGTARQFLSVSMPRDAGVRDRMAVIYGQGLVGRVASAAWGTARVQLTVDRDSRVQARFVRFERRADGSLHRVMPQTASTPLVVGDGTVMKIRNVPAKEIEMAGVRVGDWLVVWDSDLPGTVQGFLIGHVTEIRATAPLWAEITVTPPTDLRRLQEVLIVNRP